MTVMCMAEGEINEERSWKQRLEHDGGQENTGKDK